MSTFRNNLQKNDRVYDTVSKRQAKVARAPRNESQRKTAIVFDGTHAERYLDVMQLRLMPDGRTPEDVPPVEGTPPATEVRSRAMAPSAAPTIDSVAGLKVERANNLTRMSELEKEFKALKARNEKIDQAITLLSA